MGGWRQLNAGTMKWEGDLQAGHIRLLGTGASADTNPALTIDATGSGASLIKFNTERTWTLQQNNTGATAQLYLKDVLGGKHFCIVGTDDKVNFGVKSASIADFTNKVGLVCEEGAVGIGLPWTSNNAASAQAKLHIGGTSGGIVFNNLTGGLTNSATFYSGALWVSGGLLWFRQSSGTLVHVA